MNVDDIIHSLEPLTSRVRNDITAIKTPKIPMAWTKQSLTRNRLTKHIEGDVGRGVCPIKENDDRTSVAVLDLDSHGGETPFSEMLRVATQLVSFFASINLYAHAFRSSGGRGIHLYFIWDEPQDAYTVRVQLAEALSQLGFKNGTGGVAKNEVEIFPKQDHVPHGGNGSQFILPYHAQSEPIDLDMGIMLGKEPIEWRMSRPIEKLEKPVRQLTVAVPTGEMVKWGAMVMAIDPDCSYEEWVRVGMALHFEADGSPDGLAIWDEWSAGGSKYPGLEALEAKWQTFGRKDNLVTGGSIEAIARTAGYVEDIRAEFEDIFPETAGDTFQGKDAIEDRGFMKFERNDDGYIKANVQNVLLALSRPDYCFWDIRYDAFRDEIVYRPATKDESAKWQQFGDADYTRLRDRLGKKGFMPISRDMMRDCVLLIAEENKFDTAIHWLESLPAWDGIKRIDTFMPEYFGAADTPYTRAVGAYIWTALAGRVLSPGCKADMCPILVGKQGIRKSTAVSTMVPVAELFCEVSFAEKDDDLARKMRGCLVAEIGELRGLHTKELEGIKAFIARTHEKWVPKFKEFTTTFARRLIFIGTTNQPEFLADETGNRRWLPVDVVQADTDAIKRDRLQMWAEGRARFNAGGVEWQRAETLAKGEHERYMITDGWQDLIVDYLNREEMDGTKPADAKHLLGSDIMSRALNFDLKHVTMREENRLAKIMKGLGFEKHQKWLEGKNRKVWLKPLAPIANPSGCLAGEITDSLGGFDLV